MLEKVITRSVIFALILFPIVSTVSFASEESSDTVNVYTLGTGDEIRVSVYGEPDLSGTYKVSSAGTISVPLIGDIELRDLSLLDAENLLKSKFADGYLIDPSISLQVEKHRPFYIMGEVRKPGQYAYINDMTALQAVALAGGFTYRAKQNRMKIKSVDGALNAAQPGVKIKPGDVIVIEERFF